MQLASYLERGPLMWMMPLHLHVNQKSDYDIMMIMKTNYCIMQVKSIAEEEHSEILRNMIKIPFIIKIFVLSI